MGGEFSALGSLVGGFIQQGSNIAAGKSAEYIAMMQQAFNGEIWNDMTTMMAPQLEQQYHAGRRGAASQYMTLAQQGIGLFNTLKGPGEYKETAGLKGFMDEMNKEFEYDPSASLEAAMERAALAAGRSGIAGGTVGGAAEANKLRVTTEMALADLYHQEGRFDTKQQAKALARLEDPNTQINQWLATKVAPYQGASVGLAPSNAAGNLLSASQGYMGQQNQAYANQANILAQTQMNQGNIWGNAFANAGGAMSSGAENMFTTLYGRGGLLRS